jgi:hypothetical protein
VDLNYDHKEMVGNGGQLYTNLLNICIHSCGWGGGGGAPHQAGGIMCVDVNLVVDAFVGAFVDV